LRTESFIQRGKTCIELPTNEFIEQRGGSHLKGIDIMPLSVFQTEDSPDSIPERKEDCIIGDGTEEYHASHMEEVWEQNENNGKHNEQHRLSISTSNVHPFSRSFRTLPTEQCGAVHTKKTLVAITSSS
jgi:hypothetical protein